MLSLTLPDSIPNIFHPAFPWTWILWATSTRLLCPLAPTWVDQWGQQDQVGEWEAGEICYLCSQLQCNLTLTAFLYPRPQLQVRGPLPVASGRSGFQGPIPPVPLQGPFTNILFLSLCNPAYSLRSNPVSGSLFISLECSWWFWLTNAAPQTLRFRTLELFS